MANWFTRQLDRFTPFNMPGEVQRRKKKEEEQANLNANVNNNAPKLRVTNAAPTQQIVQQPQLKPQQPTNIFETLNKNLTLGKPNSTVPVFKTPDVEPVAPPKPGLVVKPTNAPNIILPDGRRAIDVPDTPETIINRGLDAGKSWEDIAKENNYRLDGVKEYSQLTRPNYGIKVERPQQANTNKIRDIFDANTEADKFRRQEGNRTKGEEKAINLVNPGNIVGRTPIVGHIAKGLNTLGAQGAEIPATVEGMALTKINSDLTKEMLDANKRGDKFAENEAKRKLDLLAPMLEENRRMQDAGHSMFEKNKGGLFNTGTLYDEEASMRGDVETALKDIALPTVVTMADLYTLGQGSIISEGLKGGVRVGLPKVAPNIIKATAGNYVSGDLSARAEGATGWDPVKSGSINAVLGIAPDVALPAVTQSFKSRILPKIFRGGKVAAKDVVDELDDAAISASAEAANQAMRPRPIPVKAIENIPVNAVDGLPENIRVRNMTEPKPLIKEFPGDASLATPDPLIQRFADDAQAEAAAVVNNAGRPDPRIEGVTPRKSEPFKLDDAQIAKGQQQIIGDYADMLKSIDDGAKGGQMIPDGQGGYIRTSEHTKFYSDYYKEYGRAPSKAAWRDYAEQQLRNGQAIEEAQKAFNDLTDPEVQSMLAKGEQIPVEEGRPISVKQVNGINVMDDTKVPTNLPETPGTVRATTATAPSNAKSAVVAAQTPATILPKEVQDVLDNPKKYNKRQVAAARNQRKLARQMAKTQEDTAAAMQRIEASKTNPGAGQPEGFAPTGEFRVGKRGNVSESASRVTEAQAGTKEMADRSVDDLLDEISTKDTLTPGDRRRISAAKENLMKSDPEGFRSTEKYQVLDKLEKASRSDLGRGLALIPRTIRKTADADALTARWERKIGNVLDDPSKMTDGQWKQVQSANDAFTTARNKAASLEEQFRKTGSEADYNAWEKAHKAARDADTSAKMTEVKVAQQVLKGEKGANVTKTIDALKKEADVNTMDFVTANMLSGTGTGFRNTFGTELAGVENRVGANIRAKITKGIFGENVGGFDRAGARYGRKTGVGKWVDDIKRRGESGGKNPIEWGKNWATAINSGGESSMQSQVYSRLAKYYKNQFAEQGIDGKNLDLRMKHAMITDPDAMADIYLDATMKSSGLTGMFEKGQTIEKAVADYVGGKFDSKLAQGASKVVMRMLVGFPTATGNFIYQSGKRLTLGLPSYIEAGVKAAKGDKMGAALAFERGLKETGSGSAALGLGVVLGSSGMISGAYPSDPEERARWEREGISENSIKIGGAWYPIPQGAGMFGLPLLTGAAIGRDGPEGIKEMYTRKNLAKMLPTDQIQGALNTLSDNGESPQAMKNMLASSVRAVTPLGALLNQISKSFDDTKNDTTTKDFWSNTLDQIYSGIPGVNNAMNIPDKLDDAGNPIKNPNPVELAFGATSAVQGGGEQRSQEINDKINAALSNIDQYGLLGDANMDGVLEGSALEAFNKSKSGKQLDQSDIKALKEGLVKGVSSEGTDTAYLEREQYDTNLAVLKLKRDLMNEDKTTKPSSLKDVENAIKRGEIYKENKTPYDLISEYQSTGVEDWRKMGIGPEDEDYDPDLYNPEMYQKLFDIDRKLTEGGVSYKKGSLDKPKYFVKETGKGKGSGSGSGVRKLDTSFGTLKDGSFAPRVQQYSSIDAKSGSVPIIRTVRPNIVHKITSSR